MDLLSAIVTLAIVMGILVYLAAAALDRQHPRDLFDMWQLFAHEGITPGIRKAFVIYLAGHNRPIHEVLFPKLRDIELDYRENFSGMTGAPIPLATLYEARTRLLDELHAGLSANERGFLLSLAHNAPRWELLDIEHARDLPALRWKIRNLGELQKADPTRLALHADALEEKLSR